MLVLAVARNTGIGGAEAIMIDAAAAGLADQIAAYPPVPVLLNALLDSTTLGLLPSPADGLSVFIAGLMACTAPRPLLLLAPGIALAAAQGPGTMLLCLLALCLGLCLYRCRLDSDPLPLIGAGLAAGFMPFTHPAGAALALACAPLGILSLTPALVAGRGLGSALMLGWFPLVALAGAFAALSALYGGDPLRPFAGLMTATPASGILSLLAVPLLAPALLPLLWQALARPGFARVLPAGLALAPMLTGLLHGLGGGEVALATVAGPACTAACLADSRSLPALIALSWLLALAASSPC